MTSSDFSMLETGIESIGMLNMSSEDYQLSTAPDGMGQGSRLANDYSNAHCFPNPYKPNSGLGHARITFTRLTSYTKLKVYTIAGELVYDREADTPEGTLIWDVKNNAGENVASGVYIYVINNNLGHKKIGKFAVVR